MKEKFDISGMTCSACSSRVEKSVQQLEGVQEVQVNLLTNSMQVVFDQQKQTKDSIVLAVEKAGYGAKPQGEEKAKSQNKKTEDEIQNMKHRLISSLIFLVPLFYLSMGSMMGLPIPHFMQGHANAMTFAFTQFLLTLPILMINKKYFIVGFKALWHRSPNMDSLIAIGSSASFIYGIVAIYKIGYGLGHGEMAMVNQFHMDLYFESSGMILTLITLGKYLETKSKGKTSEAIQKLMSLSAQQALVERDGVEQIVAIDEVKVNDIVILKPGMSVPIDGVIVEGSSSFDESALTGESLPVSKTIHDRVTCATINLEGYVRIQATQVGNDTTLAKMIALVEEASASKAPIAKLADKISGIFVPVVILISILSFVIWIGKGASFDFAFSIAISVLVISCPCALGLATPVAIMVGMGQGASHGILFKSSEALETAQQIDTILLDKTGTITQGLPQVVRIVTSKNENEFLQLAASVEKQSEHQLAKAIVDEAFKKEIELLEVKNFEAIFGKGIRAMIQNQQILGGNETLMKENEIDLSHVQKTIDEVASNGWTPLIFAMNQQVIGVIAVGDVIKATSHQAIQEMRKMGIHVVMVTGDHQQTAHAIQQQVGVDEVIAEVLPEQKAAVVRQFQKDNHIVAMVGDGINDALALTQADVGIAIGAGSDIALESAQIVLMKNDLKDVSGAIRLSKATLLNIKENLFWAFFYNAIGIPLAAGVFYGILGWKLNPMFASAAMSLSSVSVVSNALRLKRFKMKQEEPVKEKQKMMKVITIQGMMCQHCVKHVEKALSAIEGIGVQVSLEQSEAICTMTHPIADEVLKKAVEDAGYEVTSIEPYER